MFAFDPWQLLGITPTSTINEARRAYYDLARIMHPDRGGNAEDMRALYDAYRWVYEQLIGATMPITVDDPSKTPIMDTVIGMDKATLSERYDRLRNTDDSRTKIMVLDWIKYIVEKDMMVGRDLRDIDDYIRESIEDVSKAQGAMYPACVEDGYGGMMDPHEEITEYGQVIDSEKQGLGIGPGIPFCKEVAVYKEPICPSMFNMQEESLNVPKTMDDYSGNKERLCMTDYAIAYSCNVICDVEAYKKECMERLTREVEDGCGAMSIE